MSLIIDSKDVFSKLPCLNPPTPSRGKQAVGGAPSLDTGMISLQIAMAWWECVCMGWEVGLGDGVGQNPTNSVHLRLLALLFPGGLHIFCYDRHWSLLMSVQRGRLDEMLRASMHRGRPA